MTVFLSVNANPAASGDGSGDQVAPQTPHDNGHVGGEGGAAPPKPRDMKNRSSRPPQARRNDNKPKETLVNGTTA